MNKICPNVTLALGAIGVFSGILTVVFYSDLYHYIMKLVRTWVFREGNSSSIWFSNSLLPGTRTVLTSGRRLPSQCIWTSIISMWPTRRRLWLTWLVWTGQSGSSRGMHGLIMDDLLMFSLQTDASWTLLLWRTSQEDKYLLLSRWEPGGF